jgi:hypothetical protein
VRAISSSDIASALRSATQYLGPDPGTLYHVDEHVCHRRVAYTIATSSRALCKCRLDMHEPTMVFFLEKHQTHRITVNSPTIRSPLYSNGHVALTSIKKWRESNAPKTSRRMLNIRALRRNSNESSNRPPLYCRSHCQIYRRP